MPHPFEPVFPFVKRIIEEGYKAYIVGGAVREYLLGNQPKEFDIATNIPPDKLQELFEGLKAIFPYRYCVFELKLPDGIKIEFARMRKDINYDGRHSDVIFTDSLEDDLRRREITINGMAFDIETSSIIDPFGGEKDIKAKLIRTIGNPLKRFKEDKIRIFRAIRFAVRLGFKLERETENAIKTIAPSITDLSSDAIRLELEKIFELDGFSRGIYLLCQTGLLKSIFDVELSDRALTELLCSANFLAKRSRNINLRWAIFLYFLSPKESIINAIVQQKDKRKVIDYILKHIDHIDEIISGNAAKDIVLDVLDNENLPGLVLCADAVYYGKTRMRKRYEALLISNFPGVFSKKIITGDDLIKHLGVSGVVVGRLLSDIRFLQLKGEIKTKSDALAKASEIVKQYKKHNRFGWTFEELMSLPVYKPEKKAVIDIGSNSILLLVAGKMGNKWEVFCEDIEEPRIGEGLVEKGVIQEKPFRRAVAALERIVNVAKKYDPDEIIVVGTSPFRLASNAEYVKAELERVCGRKIRVLSEDEERRLTFIAALEFSGFNNGIVQVEFGGLTTEISIGNRERLRFSGVFEIGAIKIRERFNIFPPVEFQKIERTREILAGELPSIFVGADEKLIVSGGTITTIACYLAGDKVYVPGSYHRMCITKDNLIYLAGVIHNLSVDDVRKMFRFAPSRADIILAGLTGILAIMDWLKKDTLFVNERGLRWGLLVEENYEGKVL